MAFFSSNDKQSLPSEEREESKEVQESKGKGIFLVGGQTALIFSKKAIPNVGKVKVTENCVENTDFAFAATSRPGPMPRQLPARLSGIRSIARIRKTLEKLGAQFGPTC